MHNKALLWFGLNLRINDNAMIQWAEANSSEVIALAFEPQNKSKIQKEYYLSSVNELQRKFHDAEIPFYIIKGSPALEIAKWVKENSIDFVLVQEFFNLRDRKDLIEVEKILGPAKIKTFFDQTLIHKNDLPFEIIKMPSVFTDFRKIVEKSNCISLPVLSSLDSLSGFNAIVPAGTELVLANSSLQITKLPFDLTGGESGALARLQEYFWQTRSIQDYKNTRNGMLAKNDSSKFSPGLSYGCISARTIWAELLKFEEHFGSNDSTEWFKMELLWRDYFKFLALKVGAKLFSPAGISSRSIEWSDDLIDFKKWCEGETDADFIDANMIELNKTGWMSNRGRQNAASYLAKTLKINWTWGAKYFEDQLLDYDTESNWGNWLYVAGVGTDPRDRTFDFQRQAAMYDTDFSYRKKWLA